MSHIQKLIDQDESIINCKKQSKILFKKLKKSDPNIKLMHCQIKMAQEMGYCDWFDLYNTVKKEVSKNLEISQPIENILLNRFESLLEQALKTNATDIHIKATPINSEVLFRINGILKPIKQNTYSQSLDLINDITQALINEINPRTLNTKEFEELSTLYVFKGKEIVLYYHKMSIQKDIYMVVKISYKKSSNTFNNLTNLGYSKQQYETLKRISNIPVGSTMFAGLAGSGKYNTLNTFIKEFLKSENRLHIYHLTGKYIENVQGITTIPIAVQKDFDPVNTQSYLKKQILTCMKSDPDIIIYEEVKDTTTSEIMKKVTQSGIQWLSTIYASSALNIINKLLDFGLNNSVVGSQDFLNALTYQKMVPVVCSHCGISVNKLFDNSLYFSENKKNQYLTVLKNIEKKYGFYNIHNILLHNHSGCENCHHTGFTSTTACAEVIEIDNNMRNFILKNNLLNLYEYWRSLSDKDLASENMNGKNAMEHALQKMLKGEIDPLSIEKAFGKI